MFDDPGPGAQHLRPLRCTLAKLQGPIQLQFHVVGIHKTHATCQPEGLGGNVQRVLRSVSVAVLKTAAANGMRMVNIMQWKLHKRTRQNKIFLGNSLQVTRWIYTRVPHVLLGAMLHNLHVSLPEIIHPFAEGPVLFAHE